MTPLERLAWACEETRWAYRCISDNQGYDKKLAREAYEHCVDETLWPAIVEAVAELPNHGVAANRSQQLANLVLKIAREEGAFNAEMPSRRK